MRFAKLTMVTGERREYPAEDHEGSEAEETVGMPTTAETTQPCMLNLETVKSFYTRKPGYTGEPRVGTRINYVNGGGIAVTEDFDTVAALFTSH